MCPRILTNFSATYCCDCIDTEVLWLVSIKTMHHVWTQNQTQIFTRNGSTLSYSTLFFFSELVSLVSAAAFIKPHESHELRFDTNL